MGELVILHILLHFVVPLLVALTFYRKNWKRSNAMLLLGLLIDADHLLAVPIYDAGRCSLGFHPLHTVVPIALYVLMLIPKRCRVLGIGLCIHILLDAVDCLQMEEGCCDLF